MILVLGSRGLLGSTICEVEPKDTIGLSRADLDVQDIRTVSKVLDRIQPDAVINCVGHVPRSSSPGGSWVNSEFPKILNTFCEDKDIRLIHVSTDCVFNEKTAERTELDSPDATTLYGMEKAAGEFKSYVNLVIRTSFVGLPDPPGRGLLAFLRRNSGKRINGWRACLWNGVTTHVLANSLLSLCYTNESGFLHIHSDTVNKYELLNMVNDIYDFNCTIVPVDSPVSYRTLSSIRQRKLLIIPPIYDQLCDMHEGRF